MINLKKRAGLITTLVAGTAIALASLNEPISNLISRINNLDVSSQSAKVEDVSGLKKLLISAKPFKDTLNEINKGLREMNQLLSQKNLAPSAVQQIKEELAVLEHKLNSGLKSLPQNLQKGFAKDYLQLIKNIAFFKKKLAEIEVELSKEESSEFWRQRL